MSNYRKGDIIKITDKKKKWVQYLLVLGINSKYDYSYVNQVIYRVYNIGHGTVYDSMISEISIHYEYSLHHRESE